MKTLSQALLLSVLAAVAAAATYRWHPRAPALHRVEQPARSDELSLEQILTRWPDGVIWLDARPQAQFDREHVPGARLLNEQDFSAQLLELLDVLQMTDKPVVIYCGGEACEASRKVREKLLTLVPIEQCYVLKGGWPAWQAGRRR